jgi:alpha-glucosidase
MLNFYRDMIAFRQGHSVLLKGSLDIVEADDGYIAFERRHGNMRMFCAFNLSDETRGVILPDGNWAVEADAPFDVTNTNTTPELPAWQALFATATGE